VKGQQQLIDWIEKQYKNGAEVATICTGAFMLASSGLLDGKNCSTHWAAADNFRAMFPKVNLQPDRLITDENGIYTNGGAYSFLNLMVYWWKNTTTGKLPFSAPKFFKLKLTGRVNPHL
jgi:transcriptional regulator GlxA family with amidase domain